MSNIIILFYFFFSTDCTHDCCFQLLKFRYEKHVSLGKNVQNKVGDNDTALELV